MTTAAFSFEKYKVLRFNYNSQYDIREDVFVAFDPAGIYHEENGIFELIFTFKAFGGANENDEFIKIDMEAIFKFNEPLPLDQLPAYFYRNSLALVFPYLRAFVTTLTTLGHIKPLILPIMNLSSLETPLRDKTVLAEKK